MVTVRAKRKPCRCRPQQGYIEAATGQAQCRGHACNAAATYEYVFLFHLAEGAPACLGHRTHISPFCFIRPASAPASSPKPQKKSVRAGPLMAAPVSCANTSRRSGCVLAGMVVAR